MPMKSFPNDSKGLRGRVKGKGSQQAKDIASGPLPRRLWFAFWLGALIYLASAVFLLFWRALNLDEGWYLLAARLVKAGKILYVDFNYTQGPVLPYVYAALSPSWRLDLLVGRLITCGLGIGCTALAVLIARRIYGPRASLLALWVMALGWFAIGQYAYVATYALAGLCLVAGVFCWLTYQAKWRYPLAALWFVLAVGTRISTLATLLVFWAAVGTEPALSRRQKALVYGFSLVGLGLVFGPFLTRDPALVWYNLVWFHTDRVTLAEILARCKEVVLSNGVIFSVFWLAAVAGLGTNRSLLAESQEATRWLFALVISLFVAHLLPRTADAYYNALQYPLMAVLIAGWTEPLLFSRRAWRAAFIAVLVAANMWGQWVGIKRYRVLDRWGSPLPNIARTVAFVKSSVAESCLTRSVTLRPILAVETETPLVEGLEMGFFSYRPTWDAQRCRHFHSVNNEILTQMVARPDVGWAAFARHEWEHHLVGFLDPLREVLRREYRLVKTFQGFGPPGHEVYFYVRRGCFQGHPEYPVALQWPDGIRLEGVNWEANSGIIELGLFWRTLKPVAEDYTVFVHILNREGRLVYGKDEQPCHNTCPFTSWDQGELVLDEHLLEPSALGSGKYQVEIGLYDAQLQRLPLVSGHDAVILLSFESPGAHITGWTR